MEKVQHPYECLAMGHAEGSRTFFAAPPDWFEAKSMTTPRNCPDCRAWVKAQVDEMKTCNCGSKIRLSANSKISYFKKDGPYVPPEECRPCREGNRPPKGTKKRPDKKEREKKKKEEKPSEFATLKRGVSPQSRVLLQDGPFYRNIIPGKTHTRIAHLERHIPGSSHDLTTPELAAQAGERFAKSASAFASGPTFEELIANTQTYLGSADDSRVREYALLNRVYRVTLLDNHDRVEITVIESVPGSVYGLVSTFDDETVPYVTHQEWYN